MFADQPARDRRLSNRFLGPELNSKFEWDQSPCAGFDRFLVNGLAALRELFLEDVPGGTLVGDELSQPRGDDEAFREQYPAPKTCVIALRTSMSVLEIGPGAKPRLGDSIHLQILLGRRGCRKRAVRAEPRNKPLGYDRRKRIGNHVGLDAEVDQPVWGTRSRIGVQSGVDDVTGFSCANKLNGGFFRSGLAYHDVVGISAQGCCDILIKRQGRTDFGLDYQRYFSLDRILAAHHRVFDPVDPEKRRIKSGAFPGSGRTADQSQTVIAVNRALQDIDFVLLKAQFANGL